MGSCIRYVTLTIFYILKTLAKMWGGMRHGRYNRQQNEPQNNVKKKDENDRNYTMRCVPAVFIHSLKDGGESLPASEYCLRTYIAELWVEISDSVKFQMTVFTSRSLTRRFSYNLEPGRYHSGVIRAALRGRSSIDDAAVKHPRALLNNPLSISICKWLAHM